MRWKRVGVLMGGLSAEREVSLSTGHAVTNALLRVGYDVVPIDATRELDRQLRTAEVEAVFVALHGRWGEDGTVQGLLEIMGIPYTGSSVLASALAMDKVQTRALLTSAGLPMPAAEIVLGDVAQQTIDALPLSAVVKPADEGSSVGVTIVHGRPELGRAIQIALESSTRAVVERYVTGAEINVALLDGEVLGSVEIETHHEFYNYSAKYDDGGSTHHMPPRLPQSRIEEAETLAARANAVIGCLGAVRVDLIVPRDDPAVILELNTIPGMTATSLLPEIAATAGLPFDNLVGKIMEAASLHVKSAIRDPGTKSC